MSFPKFDSPPLCFFTPLAAPEIPIEHIEEVAPEFIEILHSCEAKPDEEAVLECKVTGVPMPEVKWFKDHVEVPLSAQIQAEALPDGTQRLIIKQAKIDNIGEYRCEATNEAGTAWTEAPLNGRSSALKISPSCPEIYIFLFFYVTILYSRLQILFRLTFYSC